MKDNRRSILVVIIALIFLSVLAVGVYFVFARSGDKAVLSVKVIPSDAQIVIDGVSASTSNKLDPGTYDVEISRAGFVSFKQEVTIYPKNDNVTTNDVVVSTVLVPQTEEANTILNEYSPDDRIEIEAAGGKAGDLRGEQLVNNYPILRRLPQNQSYYRIDYALGQKNKLIIKITAREPIGRQVALEQIREWGFEPSDYTIEFNGFKNKFAEVDQQ